MPGRHVLWPEEHCCCNQRADTHEDPVVRALSDTEPGRRNVSAKTCTGVAVTGWDIAPAGVQSVISQVREAADGMSAGIRLYGASVQGAMESAGTLAFGAEGAGGGGRATGLVGVALGQFVEGTETDVAFLPLRASNSANGAIEATNAYLAGSLEQAWNAQRQATLAPDVTAFLEAARRRAGER
ncbi:DUF6507 family protein [Streptomyces chryseus]|uniref:DUF6507 family protein n=2 Tax=Streptomyces chryseus TaxID=68186 RepID=UPI00227D9857|nr:DUF6507 family protein [Streptomyces chryseus]